MFIVSLPNSEQILFSTILDNSQTEIHIWEEHFLGLPTPMRTTKDDPFRIIMQIIRA